MYGRAKAYQEIVHMLDGAEKMVENLNKQLVIPEKANGI